MDIKNEEIRNNEISPDIMLGYIQGYISDRDRVQVEQWLKEDVGNEKILSQSAQLYYAVKTKKRIESRNVEVAYKNIFSRIRRKKHVILLKRVAMTAAACALVLIGIFSGRLFNKEQAVNIQEIIVQTNAGMRTTLTLPDGTEVILNSSSKLVYPSIFNGKERKVTLEGEGYFSVAHQPEHPFKIDIPNRGFEAEVLGTQFNLQAYSSDEKLRATLVNGSLRLNYNDSSGKRKQTLLLPSDKAIFDTGTKSIMVEKVETKYETAWIEGKLMFKGTHVSEVLNRLSHYYNVAFEIKDKDIENYSFTGTLINRQLNQVLYYLSVSSGIEYKIIEPYEDDSQKILKTTVILSKKQKQKH
jgi:ferric-dicitrate binding protein FerR (iron transport regulator)